MKYSRSQAEKLARQIRDRFGDKIARATHGSSVPPKFLAGLISVEAGKDSKGQLSETATRFEAGVFAKLQAVREGTRSNWSGIKTAHIRDATDASLRALATSYGLTQVMGWHCINNLDCTVADLRDPDKHLNYAVDLLQLNAAGGDFERQEYVGEFKQWNSGSETGKTYDPDYVHNAGAVMDAYADLDSTPIVTEDEEKPERHSQETEQKETQVETVQSNPPVVEIKSNGVSWWTKIQAALAPITTFATGVGLKIGGVTITRDVLLVFMICLTVSFAIGAWVYNKGKDREQERLRWGMDNLADRNRNNVVAAGSKL